MAHFFPSYAKDPSESDISELATPTGSVFQVGLWGGDFDSNRLNIDWEPKGALSLQAPLTGKPVGDSSITHIYTIKATGAAGSKVAVYGVTSGGGRFAQVNIKIGAAKSAPGVLPREPDWPNDTPPKAWSDGKAAKAMTLDEARECYFYFRRMKWVALAPKVAIQKGDMGDAAGWSDFTRVDVSPTIAGVSYVYMQTLQNARHQNITFDKATLLGEAAQPSTGPVDLRLLVFMVRLAQKVAGDYGASRIFTNGIITANNDAHQAGRAIDVGGWNGGMVDPPWLVYTDWGAVGTRPTPPSFRFKDAALQAKKPQTKAIVDNMMRFFIGQVQHGTQEPGDGTTGDSSSIGAPSSIILPDHFSDTLAPSHINHFHLQIGKLKRS